MRGDLFWVVDERPVAAVGKHDVEIRAPELPTPHLARKVVDLDDIRPLALEHGDRVVEDSLDFGIEVVDIERAGTSCGRIASACRRASGRGFDSAR